MNIEAYIDRLEAAAGRCGFTLSFYGQIGESGLPVLERQSAEDAPQVYISTGVHGDEPAGPMALLELLRRKAFPDSANYTFFPMVNPTGLAAGTRENADGVDLNRDYGLTPVAEETRNQLEWIGQRQFDLCLCLHEDYDGEGFYVYAHEEATDPNDYAGIAIEAAAPHTGIDPREEIDEMPAKDGRMFPPMDVMDKSRQDLPEALRLLFHHGAKASVTTETPSCQPITQRIEAQCAVVQAILKAYLEKHA
ncbi:MAG: M14 family metallocarboxypeptidase [Puniceicoccaceae bacterium]